jgi:hypothetical protein
LEAEARLTTQRCSKDWSVSLDVAMRIFEMVEGKEDERWEEDCRANDAHGHRMLWQASHD